jgi:putative inorganic carbon (hco3(-)) transporter
VTPRILTPLAFGATNAFVPLFPSFITLTAVRAPGVSLLPPKAAAVLLCAVAVLGFIYAVRLAFSPRQYEPTLLPLLAWLGAGVLAALLGFDPRAGLVFIGIFALGIVWHLCTLRYYRERGVAPTIAWSMLVTCALASIAAIVMTLLHWPTVQYVIGHGRAIGTFVLPGELAGYLVVLIPMAAGVLVTTRRAALRAAALCALLAGLTAMILTFSRTGWMGLAAAAAFFVILRVRVWQTGVMIASGIVLAALAAVLLVFNVAHNPSENFTRLSIWQAALQIIDRFPLTGVGPFDFSRLYALVRTPAGDATAFHAHSIYLTFLAELGVVGFAAAVWAWWRFAAELRRRLVRARPEHALLATSIAAGLFGTLAQGLIDTVSVVIFGLWMPTMALALATARDGLMEHEECGA